MTEDVVVNRDITTNDVLTNTALGSTPPPAVITQGDGSLWTPSNIGNGIVMYQKGVAMTGSAQTFIFQIPRGHRLLRMENVQVVTSTTVPDTTGINLILQRGDSAVSTGINLFSTNGNQLVGSVVFVGGDLDSWAAALTNYHVVVTGQNNDTLHMRIYVRYI